VDDSGELERRFDAAMRNIYDEASRLGYRPTRFLEMVGEYGGVETAHRLLATDKIQDGLAQLYPVLGGWRSEFRRSVHAP